MLEILLLVTLEDGGRDVVEVFVVIPDVDLDDDLLVEVDLRDSEGRVLEDVRIELDGGFVELFIEDGDFLVTEEDREEDSVLVEDENRFVEDGDLADDIVLLELEFLTEGDETFVDVEEVCEDFDALDEVCRLPRDELEDAARTPFPCSKSKISMQRMHKAPMCSKYNKRTIVILMLLNARKQGRKQ